MILVRKALYIIIKSTSAKFSLIFEGLSFPSLTYFSNSYRKKRLCFFQRPFFSSKDLWNKSENRCWYSHSKYVAIFKEWLSKRLITCVRVCQWPWQSRLSQLSSALLSPQDHPAVSRLLMHFHSKTVKDITCTTRTKLSKIRHDKISKKYPSNIHLLWTEFSYNFSERWTLNPK